MNNILIKSRYDNDHIEVFDWFCSIDPTINSYNDGIYIENLTGYQKIRYNDREEILCCERTINLDTGVITIPSTLFPRPSYNIFSLIVTKRSATLRDILKLMNKSDLELKKIGKSIRKRLPKRHRERIKINRNGKNVRAILYYYDELAYVEYLVYNYFKYNN